METWITVKQAARIMDVEESLVRKLATDGALDARKFGHAWQINYESAKAFKRQRAKRTPKE